MVTHGSLFTGFGGMDLGFHRAGMQTVWQVEVNDYARDKILIRHWPDVPKFADIRDFPPADLPYVDVISGGFPCQDISIAGTGKGLCGDKSGLWYEYWRVLRTLGDRGQQPRVVVVENSGILSVRGIDCVLGGLAAIGFDADWTVLRACDFGLPHKRDRIFIVAYANSPPGRNIWQGRLCKRPPVDWKGLVFSLRDGSPDGVPTELVEARRAESDRVKRIEGIGNAVCVPVAEAVGRYITGALEGD